MEEFWNWVCQHAGISSTIVIILLTAFIQITPIKLNPWTAIYNFFTAPAKTLKATEAITIELTNYKE